MDFESILEEILLGRGQGNLKLTAPFNNMRTLKFNGQPTNAFFATVSQMFGGSSELPTTVSRAVIKSHR